MKLSSMLTRTPDRYPRQAMGLLPTSPRASAPAGPRQAARCWHAMTHRPLPLIRVAGLPLSLNLLSILAGLSLAIPLLVSPLQRDSFSAWTVAMPIVLSLTRKQLTNCSNSKTQRRRTQGFARRTWKDFATTSSCKVCLTECSVISTAANNEATHSLVTRMTNRPIPAGTHKSLLLRRLKSLRNTRTKPLEPPSQEKVRAEALPGVVFLRFLLGWRSGNGGCRRYRRQMSDPAESSRARPPDPAVRRPAVGPKRAQLAQRFNDRGWSNSPPPTARYTTAVTRAVAIAAFYNLCESTVFSCLNRF